MLTENQPAHVVHGNIFDELGFPAPEAADLKIMAELLSKIIKHIAHESYTKVQLGHILGESKQGVNNLLRGRISEMNIEKLQRYAELLRANDATDGR